MLSVSRFWRYYRYPGQTWARHIAQILSQRSQPPTTVIDAPCGDGIISFWLKRRGIHARYELYDLSASAIAKARRLEQWEPMCQAGLKLEQRNIHQIPLERGDQDVWLLINSLYLLPDIDALVARMRPRVQTIVGVFPNTQTKNYQRWKSRSPDLNINEMNQQGTDEFFAKHGYERREYREFCYVPLTQIRSKYVRLAGMFLVNPIESWFPRNEPCYWLGVYTRKRDDDQRAEN